MNSFAALKNSRILNPELSVITPNFNKGFAVSDCVESVLNQSFKNWEFIFVDDGSTDGSFEKAIETAKRDERCTFITNTTGIKGGNAARNLGIEKAKSPYIIFLDSDDLLMENCIRDRLRDFEANSDLDFIAYPMGIFNSEIYDSNIISNIPTATPDLHRFLNRDVVWQISGPIWKKETLLKLNGFDLELHSQQDLDLHIRALINGFKYKYIHQNPDVYYRREIDSIPRQESQSLSHFRQRFQMILKHQALLEKADKLGEKERTLLARYILDLSQMMRWHIETLGKNALKEALIMWEKAYELNLVGEKNFNIGISYIHFKHNMFYNRLGFLQRYLEKQFRKNLGELIFYPNTTYCNVTVNDYDS